MAHDEHIVEVDLSRRFQHLIIPVIKLFKPLFRAVLGIVVFQIQALAFYIADLIDNGGDKFRLVLDLHLRFIEKLLKILAFFLPADHISGRETVRPL